MATLRPTTNLNPRRRLRGDACRRIGVACEFGNNASSSGDAVPRPPTRDQLIGGQGEDWFAFLASDLVLDAEDGEEGLGVRL